MDKKLENILFIVVGAVLLVVVEFKLIHLAELLVLALGFIGFAAILNGVFGFYNMYRSGSNE